MGIRLFDPSIRPPIYNIYGFVRLADEIVDSFHDYDKEALIDSFSEDTFRAIEQGISLNPILHAFQDTVRKYRIPNEYVEAFLESMKMDLTYIRYSQEEYERYIYGSAEVIGLMCLKVFTDDGEVYRHLKPYARSLGSAFQKINFLRDIKSDFEERGRVYFPGVNYHSFSQEQKRYIENDIAEDFKKGLEGIKQLPPNCRKGVQVAYSYYIKLFNKIKRESPEKILSKRLRISNSNKILLLLRAHVLGVE